MPSKITPKPIELSVVAPCYNEERNIPELARRVLNAFDSGALAGELLLIDDGSSDGTAQAIREWEKKHPNRVVGRFHTENKGIAAGWRTGVDAARGRNVVIIDSDLQYQPEDILRLHRTLLDHSVDVVQGWRSAVGRERGGRYNISRAYNGMLNAAFGMQLRDNKSGFICCSREVMSDLLTFRGSYFYWQSFIMVAAHAKGYSYKEVETVFESRKQGESFLDGSTVSASIKSLWDISRAAVEYRVKAPPRDLAERFLRVEGLPDADQPSLSKHPRLWRLFVSSFNRRHKLITKDALRDAASLNRTQWLPADVLGALQDEKLRHLIRHVYRSVPYYRRQMQARDLRPEHVQGRAELDRLVCLSKQDVRDNLYFDITADNISKSDMLRVTTSGNSGEPQVFFADQRQLEFRWATRLRAKEWAGYAFGDRELDLWPRVQGDSERELAPGPSSAKLFGKEVIALDTSPEGRRDLFRALKTPPGLLTAQVESLLLLARSGEAGSHPAAPRAGALLASSQTLSTEQRGELEASFGCPVFLAYTTRELGLVAHECERHNGLHLVAEGFILELLVGERPAAAGEHGEIVITDLNSYGMPLIRYRTGDYAAWASDETCGCGRGGPRIADVRGRAPVVIEGSAGTLVPSSFFDDLFAKYEYAIRGFRVAQLEAGKISLRVTRADRWSTEVMSRIEHTIRRQLGTDVHLDVQYTSQTTLP